MTSLQAFALRANLDVISLIGDDEVSAASAQREGRVAECDVALSESVECHVASCRWLPLAWRWLEVEQSRAMPIAITSQPITRPASLRLCAPPVGVPDDRLARRRPIAGFGRGNHNHLRLGLLAARRHHHQNHRDSFHTSNVTQLGSAVSAKQDEVSSHRFAQTSGALA